MSSKKQMLDTGGALTQSVAGSAAPVGDQTGAMDLTTHVGGMRPTSYLVTVTVSSAPADIVMWGMAGGMWGRHNGRYGERSGGVVATALAVGTHHFVIEDAGLYSHVFFTKSAGVVDVRMLPVIFGSYGG